MKPVIVVSSIVDGFREYREAARAGIEAAGGRPLLVNEDFPSVATSSRNACLDAINGADYVVSIVAGRGGWTAPSGQLVVEEELEHARRRNLRVLGFVQDTPRDPNAERFAQRLSDYVTGAFRTTFTTPDDLRKQIERAVRQIVANLPEEPRMEPDLKGHSSSLRSQSGSPAMLRVVLAPERHGEVVDPVELSSDKFKIRLYEIGIDTGLLNYESAKSSELRGDTRIVEQKEADGRHREGAYVRLEISETGRLILDMNVTGRARREMGSSSTDAFTVAVETVEAVLEACFRFAGALYDSLDPYIRHERFDYNVGLYELGFRQLQRDPKSQSSHGLSMRGAEPLVAYDRSRVIARASLAAPGNEIERTVVLLVRKAGA